MADTDPIPCRLATGIAPGGGEWAFWRRGPMVYLIRADAGPPTWRHSAHWTDADWQARRRAGEWPWARDVGAVDVRASRSI